MVLSLSDKEGGASPELVVVIHGFGSKKLWMLPLSIRLKRQFRVVNWTYFSWTGSIEHHAKRFHSFLSQLGHDGPVHIVAHSMGSIVTRVALRQGKVENLHRVALLAPPNSGSPVAKTCRYLLGWLFRPIRELSSDESSYVNNLPDESPSETGVIAARYDVLVPLRSTYLSGMSDHVTVNATHNSLLFSRQAGELVIRFLNTGQFSV